MEPDRNRLRGVQPYPPGTQWYFRGQGGHEKTEELALWWDPAGSIVSDDYLPEDTSAAELWGIWAKDCNRYHERYPQRYRPGEIPIVWTVTPVSEMAPHTFDPRDLVESPFGSMPREDFLTFYTHPVHVDTGERLNWLRLPVVNKAWGSAGAQSGGFIQEATGWKPSALQPTMNVVEIAAAAGLWAPGLTALLGP